MQSTPNSEQPNDDERNEQQRKRASDDYIVGMKILGATIIFAVISALIGVWYGTGAEIGTVVLTAAIVVLAAMQSLFMKFSWEIAGAHALISRKQLNVMRDQLDIAIMEARLSKRSVDIAEQAFLANLSKRQRKEYERARSQQKEDRPQSDAQPKVAAVAPVPQSAVETQQPTGKKHAADQYPQRRRNWWKRLVIWQAIFSGIVAVCTGAQFWTSYEQWDATEKQWQSMETQLDLTRNQQRAWLHPIASIKKVEDATFHDLASKHWDGTVAQFELTNHGHVPATTKSVICSSQGMERPVDVDKLLRDHRTKATKRTHGQLVLPGVPVNSEFDVPLSSADERVEKKEAFIFVFATVEYTDALGSKGVTDMCWIFDSEKELLVEVPEYCHMK